MIVSPTSKPEVLIAPAADKPGDTNFTTVTTPEVTVLIVISGGAQQ